MGTNGTGAKDTKFMIVVLGESEIGKTPAIRKTYDIIKAKRVFLMENNFNNSSRSVDIKAVFKDSSGNYIGLLPRRPSQRSSI
jgi:hypothetical protein